MFAELHFPVGTPLDRDDIEDAIADAIEGAGEVSGAGTGMYGSNLDLDLSDDTDLATATAAIAATLAELGISGARIRFEGDDTWTRL